VRTANAVRDRFAYVQPDAPAHDGDLLASLACDPRARDLRRTYGGVRGRGPSITDNDDST